MKRILIGKSGRHPVYLDLKILRKTRMLITANSGGGKSYLLRLLAELLFPHIQVIIIDPEGEFATLREKFDYVLVGKGGEAVADVRTAELLAHRLLEHKISAICDIFEMKPEARHEWIRVFVEALMEAPKKLWRRVIIIIDEAHKYVPEKGQGESVASGSILDLCTRGRKRGYVPILASQRHAKVSKSATAELLNRLVGPTFEDSDIERAISDLSVPREEKHQFAKEIKQLEEGNFHALGRAISKERILFKVNPVTTSHPDVDDEDFSAEPPPPPEKVKALLPKLADLPKEAEAKIKAEAELRLEIRSLKAQLAARPKEIVHVKAPAPKPEIQRVEIPVVKAEDLRRIERALSRAEKLIGKVSEVGKPVDEAAKELRATIGALRTFRPVAIPAPPARVTHWPKVAKRPLPPAQPMEPPNGEPGEITKPQRKILQALREFNQIDLDIVSRHQVAGWLGIKVSGSFLNNVSALRSRGMVNYRDKDLTLTNEGLREAPEPELEPTAEGVFEHVCKAVTNPQAEILKYLLSLHPDWVGREELASGLGLAISGSFLNNLSALHSAGMVDYGSGEEKKKVRLAGWIFVGQAQAV